MLSLFRMINGLQIVSDLRRLKINSARRRADDKKFVAFVDGAGLKLKLRHAQL